MHVNHSSVRFGLRTAAAPVWGRLLQPFGQSPLLTVLNRTLRRQLAEGEFEFLIGRVLTVSITDLEVRWSFSANATGDRIVKATGPADATIRADSAALLLVAARRVDPDTLFFQRRLMVAGDTELGLRAKNLLDTLELDDLPPPFGRLLDRAGCAAERWA